MKNFLSLAAVALLLGCQTHPTQSSNGIRELKTQVQILHAADKAGDTGQVAQAMCRIGEIELAICKDYGF